MDRLFCMQVFVRVVEHGSFTRASDGLGISRASTTAAVAKLERRLGVRLLNRTTRRIWVSEEGQAYYANCIRILGEISEAEDGLAGARREPRGKLRISIPQSFVSAIFFPMLKRFIERYPQLDTDIVLTDRAVNLVEEGIDCAIRGMEIPTDSTLVAHAISATRWLTCASPDYFASKGSPTAIEELATHNCVRFVSQSTGRPRDWQFEKEGQAVQIVPSGNLRLNSFDAVMQSAIAGCGIVQVPDSLAFSHILASRLQPTLTHCVAKAPSLALVYPANRYLANRVRVFLDFVIESFPAADWWSQIVACETRRCAPAVRPEVQDAALAATAAQADSVAGH